MMGFKIIRDFVSEKDEDTYAVGRESKPPRHWIQGFVGKELNDPVYSFNNGEIKVRLLDDDGGIHYHALVDDDDESCELLLRWGEAMSGAVVIDMHIDSYKAMYGEPKYTKLLSKDGKWYSHMS